MDDHIIRERRQIIKYLRHECNTHDAFAGAVDREDIIYYFGGSHQQIQEMVDADPKGRLSFWEDKGIWRLGACQGHSFNARGMDWSLDLLDTVVQPIVFHGSMIRHLPGIIEDGLKSMGRTHVHMTTQILRGGRSGCRQRSEILIAIHASRAMEDGIIFKTAANGCVLVEGCVPRQYLIDVRLI